MENNLPPRLVMNQMLFGCVLTKAIHVAAKLNIADILASKGSMNAHELAAQSGADEESLSRLLRALASLGIFSIDETGKYSLTPLAETLKEDSPESVKAMALVLGDVFYKAYDELFFSVQTGDSGFTKAMGSPVFQYLTTNPEQGKHFDRMMTDIHGGETQPMLDNYDFSGFNTVVDIGGGNGEVITAILNKNSTVKGVLFDLPEVIDRSRKQISASGGLSSRCELVTGNFFESIVAGGDAYIMRHILHDWSDADAITILTNIKKSMNPGGKILVVEAVIQEGNEPSPFKLLDLSMLLIGGKERSRSQFEYIFSSAGLKLNRIVPFQHDLSVVEAIAV
jgi:ubiquinone/menaquinone biosynthesis C-methylase UbiE/predicted transcriptional regulator